MSGIGTRDRRRGRRVAPDAQRAVRIVAALLAGARPRAGAGGAAPPAASTGRSSTPPHASRSPRPPSWSSTAALKATATATATTAASRWAACRRGLHRGADSGYQATSRRFCTTSSSARAASRRWRWCSMRPAPPCARSSRSSRTTSPREEEAAVGTVSFSVEEIRRAPGVGRRRQPDAADAAGRGHGHRSAQRPDRPGRQPGRAPHRRRQHRDSEHQPLSDPGGVGRRDRPAQQPTSSPTSASRRVASGSNTGTVSRR